MKKNRLPVDFVSCHPYPTDFVADKNNNTYLIYRDENRTFKDSCLIRDVIEKTRYQNAEIIITEWNSSFIARDIAHDTVYKAPFVIQNNLMCLGLVDGLGVIGPLPIFLKNSQSITRHFMEDLAL